MKRMRITKKEAVQALRTEPLRAGNWISNVSLFDHEYKVANQMTCKVCAVGGVLRSKGLLVGEIDRYGNYLSREYSVSSQATKEEIRKLLKEKRWLAALSAKFESTFDGGYEPIQSDREKMCRWVNRNFPKHFYVSF